MNKIILNEPEKQPEEFFHGDLLINSATDTVYILAKIRYKYTAINLVDGNRWEDPTENVEKATAGLKFFTRNATITINNNNHGEKES